jgi:hypothetical protein
MVKIFKVLTFILLILVSFSFADFSLKNLTVSININKQGEAYVEEKILIWINSTQSKELYESARLAFSDIASWKNILNLSEVRHHVTRANAEIYNIRVMPQNIEWCNSFLKICQTTMRLDYYIKAGGNGTGLVDVIQYKPRTKKYTLLSNTFSFEQTKTGDLILPEMTKISLTIPQDADKIYFSVNPKNIEENDLYFLFDEKENKKYYYGHLRTFVWEGTSLSKFTLSYEIEFPLESEVVEFFVGMQKSLFLFILSSEGLAGVLILIIASVSFYYLKKYNKINM